MAGWLAGWQKQEIDPELCRIERPHIAGHRRRRRIIAKARQHTYIADTDAVLRTVPDTTILYRRDPFSNREYCSSRLLFLLTVLYSSLCLDRSGTCTVHTVVSSSRTFILLLYLL
jgi:hypothetical protein